MTVYKSKISASLIILITLPIFCLVAISFYYRIWDPLIVATPIGLFIWYLYRTTYYTIEGNKLNVKSGFLLNIDIDIDKIRSVAETDSILSAPAMSLDRIEVFYNKYDSVIISPPDKVQFIADLQAINPNITMTWKNKK